MAYDGRNTFCAHHDPWSLVDRVIDVLIDELDLSGLGFKTQPNETGRIAEVDATIERSMIFRSGLSRAGLSRPYFAGNYPRIDFWGASANPRASGLRNMRHRHRCVAQNVV